MKKFLLGLLIGLIIGAGSVWLFHSSIKTQVEEGKSKVGKTIKKAGRSLEKAGDKVAK